MTSAARPLIENTIPVLAVANVEKSILFYTEVLTFTEDWRGSVDAPQIASVSSAGQAIMLQCRVPKLPGCVWIGISDVQSLYRRLLTSARVVVTQRPTNQPWALDRP